MLIGKILIIDKNPEVRQAIKAQLVTETSDNIGLINNKIIEADFSIHIVNILANHYINLIISSGFSDFYILSCMFSEDFDSNLIKRMQIPLIFMEPPENLEQKINFLKTVSYDHIKDSWMSNVTFVKNNLSNQELLAQIESIMLKNRQNINKPKTDDVVVGKENISPVNSPVLGGIEGVKNRFNSPDIDTKIAALKEALNYGEAGLELVINALKQSDIEIRNQAYSLLRSRPEPTVQKILREILKQDKEYKHYRFLKYISNGKNQNITDNSTDKYYKILLIDDSAVIWKVIKDMLSPSKIDFLTAKDGKEGLELIRQEGTNLNLIILDFLLPVVSGWRVFLSIQTDNELKNIPLLIISGRREEVLDKIPLPFENFEFLEKPFDQNQLIEAIKSAIIKQFSIKN